MSASNSVWDNREIRFLHRKLVEHFKNTLSDTFEFDLGNPDREPALLYCRLKDSMPISHTMVIDSMPISHTMVILYLDNKGVKYNQHDGHKCTKSFIPWADPDVFDKITDCLKDEAIRIGSWPVNEMEGEMEL